MVNALERRGFQLSELVENKKDLSSESLKSRLLKAISFLVYPSGRKPSQQFQKFQGAFREVLNCEEYRQTLHLNHLDENLSSSMDFLHKCCICFFAEVEIHLYCRYLVGEVQNRNENIEASYLNAEALEKNLEQSFERISKSMAKKFRTGPLYWISYIKDQINLGFDPFSQGNIPSVFFKTKYILPLGKEKTVVNIRSSTPTCEDFFSILFGEAEINPEYRGYLEACKKFSKRHLYINLQDRKTTFLWKNEAPRCFALEKLQYEYPGVVTVVSLSKDSVFYWQEGPYLELKEAENFKREFVHQLFQRDTGFFFPEDLRLSKSFSFAEDINRIVERVHRDVYAGVLELSKEQRMDFIEIVYAFLIDYLISKVEPDYYNISCKDCIDRGIGMNGLFFFFQYLQQESVSQLFPYEDLEAMIFAPAIFVREREIKRERLGRMISACKRLINTSFSIDEEGLRWKVKELCY